MSIDKMGSSETKKVELFNILHVDDDEDLLEITKIYLEKMSDNVKIVSLDNPELVADKLREETFSVLISDYMMPEMTGLELLKQLRDQKNNIPFIIFTGKGREEVAIEAMNLGADYYLKKGTDPKSQYKELANYLDKIIEKEILQFELSKTEETYAMFLDSFEGIAFSRFPNCIPNFIKGTLEEITQYKEEEFLTGRISWEAILHPEDRDRVLKIYNEARKNPYFVDMFKYRIITKNQEPRWLNEYISSTSTKGNKVSQIQSNIYCIDEQIKNTNKINNLNSILTALRNFNQLITKEKDRDVLLQSACDNFTEIRGFYSAWVALYDQDGKYIISKESGLGEHFVSFNRYLEKGEFFTGCKNAFNQSQVCVISNTNENCSDCILADHYLDKHAMVTKLNFGDNMYGLLNISLSKEYSMDPEEVFLFNEISEDLSFALDNLEKYEKNKIITENLVESEERFRNLVETMNDGLAIQSKNSVLTFVNDRFCEIIGRTREEIIGNSTNTYLTEKSKIAFAEEMKKRVEGKKELYELVWDKPDGSISTTLVSPQPFIVNGEFAGSFAIVTDITELSFVRDEIKDSDHKYEALFNDSPIALSRSKPSGEIVAINPAFLELFGYKDLQEVQEFNAIDFYNNPEDRTKILNIKDKEGSYFEMKQEMKKKDGTLFFAEMNSRVFYDEEGKIKHYASSFIDLTEKLKIGNELFQSKEKYQMLFDNINDAAILFKQEVEKGKENYLEVNDKLCELLNYSKEESMLLKVSDIYSPETLPKALESAKKVLEQGSLIFEIEQITKEGNSVPVEISASKYEINNEIYVLSLVRDLSKRIQKRNERENRLRDKAFFMDIISHDLKNYLAVGMAYLDSAEFVSDNIDISVQNVLNKTKSSLVRSQSLLNNLTIMLKEDMNLKSEFSKQNILTVVNESISSLHELFPDKEIEIIIERTSEDLYVSADKLVVQLFLNLLTNAVKYNSQYPKKIEINCEITMNNSCIFSISDYGRGIHPDSREEIFTRFSKISGKSGGTGLGLFIVKKLVGRYGGRIWLESRDETDYKQGTIFKVELDLD